MPTIVPTTIATTPPISFRISWPIIPLLLAAFSLLLAFQSPSYREGIEAASIIAAP